MYETLIRRREAVALAGCLIFSLLETTIDSELYIERSQANDNDPEACVYHPE